jgi:hypothetical protein
MYSARQRLNNIAAFGVTGMMILAALCAVSDYALPSSLKVNMKILRTAVDVAPDYFSRQNTERAMVNFDLDTGLVLFLLYFILLTSSQDGSCLDLVPARCVVALSLER